MNFSKINRMILKVKDQAVIEPRSIWGVNWFLPSNVLFEVEKNNRCLGAHFSFKGIKGSLLISGESGPEGIEVREKQGEDAFFSSRFGQKAPAKRIETITNKDNAITTLVRVWKS